MPPSRAALVKAFLVRGSDINSAVLIRTSGRKEDRVGRENHLGWKRGRIFELLTENITECLKRIGQFLEIGKAIFKKNQNFQTSRV